MKNHKKNYVFIKKIYICSQKKTVLKGVNGFFPTSMATN